MRAWHTDFSDFDYGVYSDHFINAVTAKNIVWGLGWSSSGYETYLLNPENLTTGPVVILPVAVAVAIFGNTLAVPGLTLFLLNLALLTLLLRSLRKVYADDRQLYLCGILLLVFFIFFKSYYWYRLIGEMPALLLLLLAITYLQRFFLYGHARHIFISALMVSGALGAKELTLLPALVLLLIVAIFCFRRKSSGMKILTGVVLCGLSIPFVFTAYRHLLLSQQPDAWRAAYFFYADHLHDYYSGLATLREYFISPANITVTFLRIVKSALWNGGTLLHLSYAGLRGIQYWLAIYAVTLAVVSARRKYFLMSALLAVTALPLLAWYFMIAEHAMPRYLFIGLSLAVMSILFFIVSLKNIHTRRIAALLFVALVIYTGDLSSRLVLASWPVHAAPNVTAMEEVQHSIEARPPKSLAWLSMVDNNEFEYLSQTPNNFISAYDLIAGAVKLDEHSYLATHPQLTPLLEQGVYRSVYDYYVSPQNKRTESVKVGLVRPLDFDWLHFKGEIGNHYHKGSHMVHGEFCASVVFQNDYYVIEHCTSDDIRAFFNRTGGMTLRPRLWTPWILLPFERGEAFY